MDKELTLTFTFDNGISFVLEAVPNEAALKVVRMFKTRDIVDAGPLYVDMSKVVMLKAVAE